MMFLLDWAIFKAIFYYLFCLEDVSLLDSYINNVVQFKNTEFSDNFNQKVMVKLYHFYFYLATYKKFRKKI